MPYYTWMNPRTVFFLDFFWNIGSSHPYIRLKKDHRDAASFRNTFKQQFFLPHTMAPKLKSGFLNKKSKYVPPTYLLVAFCIWSTFSQQQKTAKSKCLLALNKKSWGFCIFYHLRMRLEVYEEAYQVVGQSVGKRAHKNGLKPWMLTVDGLNILVAMSLKTPRSSSGVFGKRLFYWYFLGVFLKISRFSVFRWE